MKLVRMTKQEAEVLCGTIDVARKLAKQHNLVIELPQETALLVVRDRIAKKFKVAPHCPVLGSSDIGR